MNSKKINNIRSWGNNFRISSTINEFTEGISIQNLKKFTIRGNGRSYGDSALSENALIMKNFKNVNLFDQENGIIDCNSGIQIKDLNAKIVPKGWFLKVTPGTSHATIGGCIASDVHGKNHFLNGSFSDHVISIKLLKADNKLIEISNNKFKEIFYATCGGMGLTGIILSVRLKLMKINSSNINQIEKKFTNFEALLNAFHEHENDIYNVGWIDFLNNKNNKFRSVFLTANHSNDSKFDKIKINQLNIPFKRGFSVLLNNQNMKLFNRFYYSRAKNNHFSVINYNKYFYILDIVKNWNDLYGKKGLLQLHFVLPEKNVLFGFKKVFDIINKSQFKPYLSTFKRYSSSNKNYLTFPKKGFGLAIDFPNNHGSVKLIEELEDIIVDYDGRVYLCKDSLLSRKNFEKSYENYEIFKDVLHNISPELKFKSMQSDRLGIT